MIKMINRKWLPYSMMAVVLALLVSCNNLSAGDFLKYAATATAVERLTLKIVSTRPHDTTAFTEGLELHDGLLYESSGRYGQSDLRVEDPQTGKLIREISLPAKYFAEGLTLANNKLVQLTWHENVAFTYNPDTFAQGGMLAYTGEGWGLCFDGSQFFMTNGSSNIAVRDATTFAVVRQIPIALGNQPVDQLNELECVGDMLYVNIWHSNNILRIEKATGRVNAVIDASGLLTEQETAAAGADGVLNGIAYDSDHQTFLITGKLWPWLFEVQFVPKS
ncbi:MAG: glutaminyl-peptide cyclotransferase [Chloroflexota bacterium]